MADQTLERFDAELEKAVKDALRRGAEPSHLELILQHRAQKMREKAAEG